VAFGALMQGTVGFGLALVAAPLLVLLDPALVPVSLLLLLATAHALLMPRREHGDTDGRVSGGRWSASADRQHPAAQVSV
jgi:uncharacterized membrane protein YfcA